MEFLFNGYFLNRFATNGVNKSGLLQWDSLKIALIKSATITVTINPRTI